MLSEIPPWSTIDPPRPNFRENVEMLAPISDDRGHLFFVALSTSEPLSSLGDRIPTMEAIGGKSRNLVTALGASWAALGRAGRTWLKHCKYVRFVHVLEIAPRRLPEPPQRALMGL